jgi:3-phenylpropionate/trans-cinnamate dioxygenase ferredoxin subunit
MLNDFVKVAAVGEINDGEMKEVEADGEPILLAKVGGEYFAISNICSHFFTYLTEGWLYPDECAVQCPLHESKFDLRSGEPTEPPADSPVDSYAVRLEGSDILVGPRS